MKLLRLILLFSLPLILAVNSGAQTGHKMKVIAYFSGRITQLDSFDLSGLTHLIYCFGHLEGSRFKLGSARDTAMIQKMVSLKTQNPSLKILLSMGGWGGCEHCSDGFSTDTGRAQFVESVKDLTAYFHSDGIDLDWEYPSIRLDNDIDQEPVHKTSPQDKSNFTDLVTRLRTAFGHSAEISFAAGGFTTYLKGAVDWKAVVKQVDFINLMSYDLINGYDTITGHHTALYSTPHQRESVDHAVRYLLGIGIDPKKIVIGAAFYARIWAHVPEKNHGLYQPGKFFHGLDYKNFKERLADSAGFTMYWDNTAKAPYAYNQRDSLFATFDDKRSITAKTDYVIRHQLGGIMFWELAGDLYVDGLLKSILQTANGKK